MPLIIIIVITALKDGYEDFQRHQSDKRVNYSKVLVLSDVPNHNATEAKSKTFIRAIMPDRRSKLTGEGGSSTPADGPRWREVLWEDVRVGDFVKILDNQSFPADILICATSEEENGAFVETKNLDGETNLKSRHGVPILANLNDAQQCADPANSFTIQCDRPDVDMYRLNANLTKDGTTYPVDLSMTLLRGTVLKNTAWAIGVVLFTGWDSKIVLNSGGTPSKRSKVERQMNPQVYVDFSLIYA